MCVCVCVCVCTSQEIANEVISKINMNKTHHHDHLTIWWTKVTENKESFIKLRHFYRFCMSSILINIHKHKLLKKEHKQTHGL